MEFVPLNKQSVNTERFDLLAADESKQNQSPHKSDAMKTVHNDTGELLNSLCLASEELIQGLKESDIANFLSENGTNAIKNFPRHAPVQILDRSLGACSQPLSSDLSHQESAFHPKAIPPYHPALFSHAPVSAAVESQNSTSKSTNHQAYPTFHPPFAPIPNIYENYSTFLQMSSTFSSMIFSVLQNPAAHAAASFAASFWPTTNLETMSNTPQVSNGIQPQLMNPAPSMAAIAAATVAAATAWWAAHELLPMCSPLHAGFSWPPASATTPLTNLTQSQPANEDKEENNFQSPGSHVKQAGPKVS